MNSKDLAGADSPLALRLPSEVDVANSEAVGRSLIDAIAARGPLVVDCSQLTYIDSSGARMLLQVHRAATELSTLLRLDGLRRGPRHVLTVLGVIDLFDMR